AHPNSCAAARSRSPRLCRSRDARCLPANRSHWGECRLCISSNTTYIAIAPGRDPSIRLQCKLRDQLCIEIGVESLDPSLAAVTTLLHAAKGRLRREDKGMIYAQHPGLDRLSQRSCRLVGLGVRISRQAIWHLIGALHGFVKGREGRN